MNRINLNLMKFIWVTGITLLTVISLVAQIASTADGYGGRSWYTPGNMITNGNDLGMAVIDGQLYQWGWQTLNTGGLCIGDPPRVDEHRIPTTGQGYVFPMAVPGYDSVVFAYLSGSIGGIITADNTAHIWSSRGTEIGENPIQFADIKHLSAISDYSSNPFTKGHVAMVKTDGTVWSIGYNYRGAFGNGTTSSSWTSTPVQMTGMTNAVRVAAFGDWSLGCNTTRRPGTIVLKNDGTVWVAGADCTLISGGNNYTATQVPDLDNIVDIKASGSHALALDANGDVYSWGSAQDHSHGIGDPLNPLNTSIDYSPVKVLFPTGTPPIVAIETDEYSNPCYALDEEGTLWFWGFSTEASNLNGVNENHKVRAPISVAHHVADMNFGYALTYLTRNTDYPEDERLWYTNGSHNLSMDYMGPLNEELTPIHTEVQLSLDTAVLNSLISVSTWTVMRPTTMGLYGTGVIAGTSGSNSAVGTMDCSAAQLIGSLAAGTPSEITLKLSVDISTSGTAEFTVSGSGMSVNPNPYKINVINTGEQYIYIPLQYDGSTLGSMTFNIAGVGSCNADLSGLTPEPVNIVVIPIGDICTPITPAVISK